MSEEEKVRYLRHLKQVQEDWNRLRSSSGKSKTQRKREIIDKVSPRYRK